MARNIDQIKEQIAAAFMADDAMRKLYGLKGTEVFAKTFPTVCVESVLLYVFAYGMWIIESLFDSHRADIDKAIINLKPHTQRWYVNKAKAFQIGDELPMDQSGQPISDIYATIDYKKQIVRYATAQESDGVVVLKLAKYRNMEDQRPDCLQPKEVEAVHRYFSHIKDAGVSVAIISNAPDAMQVTATIYYDAMQLHTDLVGEEADLYSESTPKGMVRTSIERVIENLPFNGTCKKSDIEDAVRSIKGVDVVDIVLMQTAAADKVYSNVTGFVIPESGYFRLDKLNLTLKPYEYGGQI